MYAKPMMRGHDWNMWAIPAAMISPALNPCVVDNQLPSLKCRERSYRRLEDVNCRPNRVDKREAVFLPAAGVALTALGPEDGGGSDVFAGDSITVRSYRAYPLEDGRERLVHGDLEPRAHAVDEEGRVLKNAVASSSWN